MPFPAAGTAGAVGVAGDAPDAESAYGSLADSSLDEVAEEAERQQDDSLSGPEPPRPVPPSMPPRNRHDAAALCVKVRGADPGVVGSAAQVQTRVSQVTYFNVSDFNEAMSSFCSEMFQLETEEEDEVEQQSARVEAMAGAVYGAAAAAGRGRDTSPAHGIASANPVAAAIAAGSGPGRAALAGQTGNVSEGGEGASGMSGEELVAAAIELASRMQRSNGAGDSVSESEAQGRWTSGDGVAKLDASCADRDLEGAATAAAAGALGHAAAGMLTEVEKRTLDWTTTELEEVKAERDRLRRQLQEVR